MSKSLEGYYQETGRAGRDGKDSDCVLFYRGQDASRLTSFVYSDVDGLGKRERYPLSPTVQGVDGSPRDAAFRSRSSDLSQSGFRPGAPLSVDCH